MQNKSIGKRVDQLREIMLELGPEWICVHAAQISGALSAQAVQNTPIEKKWFDYNREFQRAGRAMARIKLNTKTLF